MLHRDISDIQHASWPIGRGKKIARELEASAKREARVTFDRAFFLQRGCVTDFLIAKNIFVHFILICVVRNIGTFLLTIAILEH